MIKLRIQDFYFFLVIFIGEMVQLRHIKLLAWETGTKSKQTSNRILQSSFSSLNLFTYLKKIDLDNSPKSLQLQDFI